MKNLDKILQFNCNSIKNSYYYHFFDSTIELIFSSLKIWTNIRNEMKNFTFYNGNLVQEQ